MTLANAHSRLVYAAEGFAHFLAKKKANEAIDSGEKLLPIDTLGVAQITHGEEFESEYGECSCFVKVRRAGCVGSWPCYSS